MNSDDIKRKLGNRKRKKVKSVEKTKSNATEKTFQSVGPRTYQPRNDFVVFRKETVDKVNNLYVPQVSAEGERMIVVATGPKVENLKEGDEVLVLGSGMPGSTWIMIPGPGNFFLTRETNVAAVIVRE